MSVTTILKKSIFQNPSNWKYWFAIAFCLKLLLFLLQLSEAYVSEIEGFWGNTGGDTESYLLPVENLLLHGEYSPDYRMPGYAVIYFPLILFFKKSAACNLLIILQLLLASVSVYLLALSARTFFKSDSIFYTAFYLYGISSFANLFDSFLLSDSFCASATIIAVYFLSRYASENNTRDLFFSGMFLTWSMFLRPMYSPLFLFISVLLVGYALKQKFSLFKTIKHLIFFLAFFSVTESAWIIRNYAVHRRIVVLTTSLYAVEFERSYLLELMNFVKSWGGDRTWWNPDSEMRWFGVTGVNRNSPDLSDSKQVELPDYIYTSQFNLDSLKAIKNTIAFIDNPATSLEDKQFYTKNVKQKLEKYTESVQKEKKTLYYIKAPLLLLKRFFVHSGTYNLFNKPYGKLNIPEAFLKIFYSLFYLFSVATGFCGIAVILYRHFNHAFKLIIPLTALYSIILFPVLLKQIEFRYFVPAYPFLLVCGCYFIIFILKKIDFAGYKLKMQSSKTEA